MKLGWRHKTLPVERDTIRMMNLVLQLQCVVVSLATDNYAAVFRCCTVWAHCVRRSTLLLSREP